MTMNAFRLQTFAPAADPAHAGELARAQELSTLREESFRTGYLAGQAAATDSFLGDQSRLGSDLVEALNDARLGNEAARRHVSASLAPMIEALCAAIAPTLAEAGFFSEIARLVERALRAVPEARPRLRCAPELVETITGLLGDRGLDAIVEAAPELLPREAELYWAQGYDHLDLDACVAQVRACLAAHLGTTGPDMTELRQHG